MSADLKEKMQGARTCLVVVPATAYQEATLTLAKQINDEYPRVLYVSLNTIISPLRRSLENKGVDLKKFFFVDGVTKTAIPSPPQTPNTLFVPSPDALTKLSIAITNALQSFDPEVIFFESLSTLLIYEDVMTVSQFVHLLVNKINSYGSKVVFTCIKSDKEEQLIKGLSLSLDRIIEW